MTSLTASVQTHNSTISCFLNLSHPLSLESTVMAKETSGLPHLSVDELSDNSLLLKGLLC